MRSGADYHLLTRHLAQKKQAVESKLVEKAKQLSFPFRERIEVGSNKRLNGLKPGSP